MNIRPLIASVLLAGLLGQNVTLAAESDSWGFKKKAAPLPVAANSSNGGGAAESDHDPAWAPLPVAANSSNAGGKANGAVDPGDDDRKFPAGLVMAIAVALAVATGGDGDSTRSTTQHP